jgi:hypothetical protein
MHPIVIVFLIFVALGSAYFLMTNLEASQVAATGAANHAVTMYGSLAIKILMVAVVLYTIYYVVESVRSALHKRKAINRLKDTTLL